MVEEIWRRDLHQQPNSRALISKDLIILPERHTRLVRLEPQTGKLVWEAKVQNSWGWLAAKGPCTN